ncbi:MAG: PIN domain-containing protein [Nanoarchaeota archaeon]
MFNIVIDTNTLISALGWKKGNPRKVFEKCLFEECKLIESRNLIEEFTSVTKRSKFNFISEEEKQEFL